MQMRAKKRRADQALTGIGRRMGREAGLTDGRKDKDRERVWQQSGI